MSRKVELPTIEQVMREEGLTEITEITEITTSIDIASNAKDETWLYYLAQLWRIEEWKNKKTHMYTFFFIYNVIDRFRL